MSLLKRFFYEQLEINNADAYYIGITDRLEQYENEYSIEYFKKVDDIYKNIESYIELKKIKKRR